MAKSDVTGALKGIHKRNLIYHLIYPFVRMQFFHYYGEVQINGVENIPRKAPVIFAPNHQNALMDALIVLFAAPQDVVFLARADIFNKKFLAFLLNSLKILPVFRQRDGAAELGKNQEIFDISVDVLKNEHYLCVLPEGNHGDMRKLRTLVKGIFRIAFSAQEDAGNEPFVKIVPVGLDFGDYVKQNQSLLINFGKPMEVSDYWEQYQENSARAINAFKNDLAEEIRGLMIHIETDECYEGVLGLRKIYNDRMREILGIKGSGLGDRFRADKSMIARLDDILAKGEAKGEEKVRTIARKVEQYDRGVADLGMRDWVVRDRGYGMARSLWRYLTLLVTCPVFVYGFINNALPYLLPVRLVRKIKDLQFHASVKAGLAILLFFPVFYLIQTLLVGIFTGPWWIWLAYLVTLPFLGKAALVWTFRWKKTVRGSWFRRQVRRQRPAATELVNLRKEIMDLTEELMVQP